MVHGYERFVLGVGKTPMSVVFITTLFARAFRLLTVYYSDVAYVPRVKAPTFWPCLGAT